MKAVVRFLRSQNGWNLCVTLLYLWIVAIGYFWAQSATDVWDRFSRTWLVASESIAGCLLMASAYLCNPWFGKSNKKMTVSGYPAVREDNRKEGG